MERIETISNAQNLLNALEFLDEIIQFRLSEKFSKENLSIFETDLSNKLSYYDDDSAYAEFVKRHTPNIAEISILLLALAPHIQPEFLEKTINKYLPESGDFSELGGQRDTENRVFLPTAETALFLLAGYDLNYRFAVQQLFSPEHWFAKQSILQLEKPRSGQPFFSGKIILDPDYIELFTTGSVSNPEFGPTFPAQNISTQMEWTDLVLSSSVNEQITELKDWVEYHDSLMQDWGMHKKLKPGYRVLFYGPPGTGKTLTASLLGKYTDRKVFRIDLSTVVSKYIGETEKNLEMLFKKAEGKNWILFFDEADALFGKRTSVNDAHDRYANQEVSYLLQRVENFDGLVILSSNYKSNMDEAFIRRFNAIIKFPFPCFEEREKIWEISFPERIKFEAEMNVPSMAAQYELSGGSIVNVIQYACLKMLARKSDFIKLDDILNGIKREMEKEEKIFKRLNVDGLNLKKIS